MTVVPVHHRIDGPAGAPVVILSNAIGTSLDVWEPQVETLARRFRVVRYDHRGHGRSPVPDGPYSIDELGRDLLALMDRLDIERASLCGLSLGGMISLWVAAHEPARVERLVAACVVARPSSPQAWAERAATVRRDGIAAIGDLVVERWGYSDRAPEVRDRVLAMLLATPREGYAGCCEAIERLDLEPILPAIAAPTLLLAGELDPAAPAPVAEAIAGAIPDAAVRVVAGAAHLATVERADRVTALIADHLAPVLAGRPG